MRRVCKVGVAIVCCVALSVSFDAAAWGDSVRFATYNASLNRNSAGQLINDLSVTTNLQARRVAETIQRVRPDVLLINEFDYDAGGVAAQSFQNNYLSIGQNTTGAGAASPINYPYRYVAPSNTGVSSGVDFDGNGSIDNYGFGNFPGQFGMVVYSMHPIANDRTFQNFLWKDMPGNLIPANYTQTGIDNARLSSKSHWDLTVDIDGTDVHVLTSHPTPPVFDSPVFDENGRRNFDEIRLWNDYVTPGQNGYITDDDGLAGGFTGGERFVILGDQNSDPLDGDSLPGAANQLLTNPLINTSFTPSSAGGAVDGAGDPHLGDPQFDTADFGNPPGNLRVDYVLPSANMGIDDGGVFWPVNGDPLRSLIFASDHRMVFVDVAVPEPSTAVLMGIAGVGFLVWVRRRRAG
ncbi:MAG: PEP-CTERM sorting domain-containing protein [Planctomycetota bacterium]|nr:MAG: PEP-CTERM sorting domain-containing protein [Planctomycetota bacterium]